MPICIRCGLILENHQCSHWQMVERVGNEGFDTVRLVEFNDLNENRAVSCRIRPNTNESRHLGLCSWCRINTVD
jgi:hypothetical protein